MDTGVVGAVFQLADNHFVEIDANLNQDVLQQIVGQRPRNGVSAQLKLNRPASATPTQIGIIRV